MKKLHHFVFVASVCTRTKADSAFRKIIRRILVEAQFDKVTLTIKNPHP